LITNGNFEKDLLEKISSAVTATYSYPVFLEESRFDINTFYDPFRRQYDANSILKEIDSLSSPQYIRKIGLVRVDLFIPVLTFIFGQAVLNGTSGVASLYRLRNEQYGIKKDDALLFDRFRKVIIHELGHTFGLIHCHTPTCVMRSSTYVEDIDQKSHFLCPACHSKLNTGMDTGR
jgi:archaemetzincin